jgi:hypothetical protein
MDHVNIRVSKKIRLIQGQNVGYAVGRHNRGKTRIVHLNSTHLIGGYQLPPDRIDLIAIEQESHCAFDVFDASVGFRNREAVAISLGRSRADVPEFCDVSQAKAKFSSLFEERLDTGSNNFMLGIGFL